MTPYYEQDGVIIYHGDCREVLPTLGAVEHVVTDPPYGIGASSFQGSDKNGWKDYGRHRWDDHRPQADLLIQVIAKGKHAVVWGGNYFLDARCL